MLLNLLYDENHNKDTLMVEIKSICVCLRVTERGRETDIGVTLRRFCVVLVEITSNQNFDSNTSHPVFVRVRCLE